MTHSSYALLLLLFLPILALLAMRKIIAPTAVSIVMVAVFAALGGEALYSAAVNLATGERPVRPPFLTARLIDEGPGYRLLKETCPAAPFVLCRYLDRMPADSDAFLWSTSDKDGVFSAIDLDDQKDVARQDFAFAAATFRRYPGEVLGDAAKAFARQLAMFDLNLYRGREYRPGSDSIWTNLPQSVTKRMVRTRAAHGSMPVRWSELASTVSLAVSLALAVITTGIASRSKTNNTWVCNWLLAMWLGIFGVVANAAVTGALSKPDPRYNARIAWVLPVLAGAAASQLLRRRQNAS